MILTSRLKQSYADDLGAQTVVARTTTVPRHSAKVLWNNRIFKLKEN